MLYGNISAAEFKKLLPLQSNEEYLSNFYKEVKRIASANSGINSPRCNLGARKRRAPNLNADNSADDSSLPATGDQNEQIDSNRPCVAKQATKTSNSRSKKRNILPKKTPCVPRKAGIKASNAISAMNKK